MAAIEERSGRFRIHFRWHGKQQKLALGKVSAEEAASKAAQVDYLLMRLKQRLIELPPDVDIVEFVQFDGKPPADLQEVSAESRELTLAGFRDRYLATHSDSLEDRTIEGIGLHFKHLVAALGERFPIRELKLADLQGYVDRRAKAKGMSGKRLSPATIKKELVTLRTAWNWAEKMGIVTGRFPYHGLRYPKSSEKPPFRTIDEIERRLKAGGITTAQRKELWESLYLRTPEIAELLVYAKEHAAHPWIFPMICMAAHTGARRSELTRMLITDVDFDGGSVTIREKKRVKGKDSTRRAPLTTVLKEALQAWLAVHPGGNTLFCHAGPVERSRKRSRTTGHQSGKGGQRRWLSDWRRCMSGRNGRRQDRSLPGNCTTISAARFAAESGRSSGACTCCGTLLRRASRRQESINGLSMTSWATSPWKCSVATGTLPRR